MFYIILETGGDVIPVKAGVGVGHNSSITNNASHSSNQVRVSMIRSFASSDDHLSAQYLYIGLANEKHILNIYEIHILQC